jgi:hypothetical protein
MDFARETRGHTARAACGHTSSGGKEWTTRSSVPELLEASVRGHAAMRRCTLGGMAPNVRFPKTLARPARAGSGRRRCVDGEVLELNLSSRRLRKDFLRLLLKCIHRADVWDWTVANARDAQLGETFIRGHAVHNHNIQR